MKFWRKPLDVDNLRIPRGQVRVIIERCKGCAFCVEYCPKHILLISKKFNKKGYHYPEVIDNGVCVDCNLCEAICPEFAIYSVPVEEESATEEVTEEAPKKKEKKKVKN
jgi:2-oxoglutarate ferredoxin oxidoreductase subunit delta